MGEHNYQMTEKILSVPLDYSYQRGSKITLYAREICRNESAPICVFLQGGPGFPCPEDLSQVKWLDYMLDHFRVLLVDQRGTGRSQPISAALADNHPTTDIQLYYLSQFRADNIVRDLEMLREQYYQSQTWFLLGQSFGGFISCHYLSVKPEALAGVMICGGLPPMLLPSVSRVYDHLVSNIYQRNQLYYERYPEDKAKVKRIVDCLVSHPVTLGDGGTLTARRFLDIGLQLGITNGMDKLHQLLATPFTDHTETQLNADFIDGVCRQTDYDRHPLYALLHEAIYCEQLPSQWSAAQALRQQGGFSLEADTVLFFGETIQPEMFEEYAQLRPFQAVAHQLAEKKDWPALYDHRRLAHNQVPIECIVYEQDFYVDMVQSLRTALAIKGANVWLHPEWQHDAIRTKGAAVLQPMVERLLARIKPKCSERVCSVS